LREVLSSSTVSSVQKLNEIYFHHYCEILAIASPSPSPSVIRKTESSIIDLWNKNPILFSLELLGRTGSFWGMIKN